jgi:hypothetical protein
VTITPSSSRSSRSAAAAIAAAAAAAAIAQLKIGNHKFNGAVSFIDYKLVPCHNPHLILSLSEEADGWMRRMQNCSAASGGADNASHSDRSQRLF